MTGLHKWGLALAVTLLAVGGSVTGASAATKTKDLPLYTTYVRTKKAMTIGAKLKTKAGYRTVYVKKNQLLAVSTVDTKQVGKNFKEYATFTLGAVHYAKIKNLKYSPKRIRLSTANFKRVKTLKAPVRTQLLLKGTGYKIGRTRVYQPGLVLTLDNYLQTYSKSQLKKYDANWLNPSTDVSDFTFMNKKPLASVKVTKLTKKGKTYTLDYKTPLKGFADKKISKHHYRLTIKQLGTSKQNYLPIDDTYDAAASWTNYQLNNKPYFSGQMEWGLD